MDAVTVSAHLTNPIQLSAAEGEKNRSIQSFEDLKSILLLRETKENSPPHLGLISQYIILYISFSVTTGRVRSNLSDILSAVNTSKRLSFIFIPL